MGAGKSSLTSIDGRCEWCGAATVDAKQRGDYSTCSRCSGIVGRRKATRRGGSSSSSSSSSRLGEEEKESQLPLSLVHLLPFVETLPSSDTAPTEQHLLSQYLTPYFAAHAGTFLTAGQRFQIREVDFKVVATFPPAGLLTPTTRIRCMYPPLHALTELKRLHVLPTAASLPTGSAGPPSSQVLFHEHLKPYFVPANHTAPSSSSSSSSSSSAPPPQHHLSVGDTFMSRGLQFKVIACVPSDGIVTTSCDIFVEGEPLLDVQRIAILPIYESLPNNEKSITPEQVLERYLHPHFSGRFQLVGRGDALDIDGVTFKVTACEPERGLVTMATEIFTQGEPLRAEELRRQQELEDEELARRMQREEAREQGLQMPMPQMPFSSGLAPFGPIRRAPAASASLPNADELRLRLQELLRQMPEHDGHRIIVRRMLETLPQNHGASKRDIDSLPTRVFTARPQQAAAAAAAAAAQQHGSDEKAEKKDGGGTADGKEESREHLMCMVCLSDYEAGETLRTLPCFHSSALRHHRARTHSHCCCRCALAADVVRRCSAVSMCVRAGVCSYHQECIDEWLQRNKACPLCKNPIC